MLVIFQNLIFRLFLILFAGGVAGVGVYTVLPPEAKILVPFTSQAPEGVWSEPWQNACEEASIIMIDNFYKGDALSKEEARAKILNIFAIKEELFGVSEDESMETVAAIINKADLNWTAQVVTEPTIEMMKQELAAQRPIIVPVYARVLDNPYYGGEGPDYHVLVLVGYDDKTNEFITHDPGTVQGKDFRYGYQELYGAINDFLTPQDYTAGPARVIFTSPAQP